MASGAAIVRESRVRRGSAGPKTFQRFRTEIVGLPAWALAPAAVVDAVAGTADGSATEVTACSCSVTRGVRGPYTNASRPDRPWKTPDRVVRSEPWRTRGGVQPRRRRGEGEGRRGGSPPRSRCSL